MLVGASSKAIDNLMHKLARTKLWLAVFVGANILMILLQIYKQAVFVQYAYTQQRLEREKKQLIKHKAQLISELHAQQAHAKVRRFATEKLGMRKVELKQIRKME